MKNKLVILICMLMVLGLTACGKKEDNGLDMLTYEGSMEMVYAKEIQVDNFEGGYHLIQIGEDRYLTVPEGADIPRGLPTDIKVLNLPIERFYIASSSVLDFFLQLDTLDYVMLCSTKENDWSLPEIREKIHDGSIVYAGKYSAPDYELILDSGIQLVVENTMIAHSPEVKEQLEKLGLTTLMEKSSREMHPLGRVEWIKLYGILCGKEKEANAFFNDSVARVEACKIAEEKNKSVAFFYISSNGYVNIRKPGDYISKMIELAGGRYLFEQLEIDEENAMSTMNMQMEAFYAEAVNADILIYNSTVDAELEKMDDLLGKSELFADFKAVKEGNVWCTGKNMFQQTTGAADMITDLYQVISNDADSSEKLTYLHKLS